jgi:hypothetical protein
MDIYSCSTAEEIFLVRVRGLLWLGRQRVSACHTFHTGAAAAIIDAVLRLFPALFAVERSGDSRAGVVLAHAAPP